MCTGNKVNRQLRKHGTMREVMYSRREELTMKDRKIRRISCRKGQGIGKYNINQFVFQYYIEMYYKKI